MGRPGAPRRGRRTAVLAVALASALLSGCVADPPPPTVVGEERSDGEAVRRSANGILIALDRVDEGFNPHLLADQGVDTDLVAALIFPSAFVPGPAGEPTLNTDLLESAGPLPDDPRTVRYVLRQKAQWSDGVPVAAEDFEYLWRQMTTQPGVVDPSGYERIADVRPGAGGKVVDVVFSTPPHEWQSLFSHLLPGHVLKDAPDGFQGSLRRLPVTSAGPFMVRVADIGRGEIEFVRNDRYWSRAPDVDQVLVRRATGAGQLGTGLRGGPGSLSLVTRTPVAVDVARTVPGVVSEDVLASAQLELAFNTVAPAMSDPVVRRAVAAGLRADVVGRIVTGEVSPGVTAFPFPDDSATTPTDAAEAVPGHLTTAGYTRSAARWERDGAPLSLTLGVEAADDRAVTAANTVADQLRAVGIGARVWELDPVALYADALPHGLVDAVVGWQRIGGVAATAAVSRFACPAPASPDAAPPTPPGRTPTTVSGIVPPEPDIGRTPEPGATSTTRTTPTSPPRTLAPGALAATSGISAVCDPDLDRALGTAEGPDLEAAAERVAELALRVPLVRPGLLFSGAEGGSGIIGRDGSPRTEGPGTAGPRLDTEVFDTAPTWRRTG